MPARQEDTMKDDPRDPQETALRRSGRAIRTIREKAGMSQEALSFEAGVDQSTISKVERLGPHVVSWQKLCSLVRELGCVVEISFVRSGVTLEFSKDEHH